MDLRLLAAVSGELDGLNVVALCRERGVSRKTFYKWRARYRSEGVAGLEARSRRPRRSPTRVADEVEDSIIEARKWLLGYGLDAGPASIAWRIRGRVSPVPSEATIWRVLSRRGFVVPQPRKRPKTSWRRFEAAAPNECWQIDATEWSIARRKVEIFNIIDDHSRLLVASRAVASATSEAAWAAFSQGVERWGLPTRCLSDNGLAFSGRLRGFEVYFETQLRAAGIRPVCARPFHPQTCGKVERFQQTLKRWLAAQARPRRLEELQAQIDAFAAVYNHDRPHRGIGRVTPFQRWAASPPSSPDGTATRTPAQRLRVVSRQGVVQCQRWHIHIGADYAGQAAEVIIDGDYAAVVLGGQLLRHFRLDPKHSYQRSGLRPGPRRRDGS